MKLYLDMDGVLADLDGFLASSFHVPLAEIQLDRGFREELIRDSRRMRGLDHYLSLPPLELEGMRSLVQDISAGGVSIEILTSYGWYGAEDMGVLAHQGKREWLMRYYSEAFHSGQIDQFNGVHRSRQKQFYAEGPQTLLVDDEELNIKEWYARGGVSIHFKGVGDLRHRLKGLGVL